MFLNVGQKIKKFAKVMFWISVVLSAIVAVVGLAFLVQEDELGSFLFVYAAVSLFFSLIGSWVLFGYGEIVEKVSKYNGNDAKENKDSDCQKAELLATLRDKGMLTEAEYQAQIGELIANL